MIIHAQASNAMVPSTLDRENRQFICTRKRSDSKSAISPNKSIGSGPILFGTLLAALSDITLGVVISVPSERIAV